MKEIIKKFLHIASWDSGRGRDIKRVLGPFIRPDTTLLDGGCGEYGLALQLSTVQVTGVDLIDSKVEKSNFEFRKGSILSLPFSDSSFSIATSVDVLEHMPPEIRTQAIGELIRVARSAILLAFPCGTQARKIDEDFAAELTRFNKPEPEWLSEHLESPYPELSAILSVVETEAKKHDKNVDIKIFYSERIQVSKMLRWVAARSNKLFMLANLFAGMVQPLISRTNKDNSYRVILLAEFR